MPTTLPSDLTGTLMVEWYPFLAARCALEVLESIGDYYGLAAAHN
jgi:hypothetical protein